MVKLVVFDAFGTLVRSVTPSGPYFKLARLLAPGNFLTIRHQMMTENRPFSSFVPEDGSVAAVEVQAQLDEEIAGLELYPDSATYLDMLRWRGYEVAVCSNLAQAYGDAARRLLSPVETFFFSYETGFLKPDPRMFACITEKTGLRPDEILFVGDSMRADVDGPRKFGMHSGQVQRYPRAAGLAEQVDAHLRAAELAPSLDE